MEKKSEITLVLEVKTIVHHNEDANLEELMNVMFDEIVAMSAVPAENWKLKRYTIEEIK